MTEIKDPYPQTMEFDVERDRLRRYLRAKSLVTWLYCMGMVPIVLAFSVLVVSCSTSGGCPIWFAWVIAKCAAFLTAAAMILGGILFLLTSYWPAEVKASSIRLQVEGSFLRLTYREVFKKTDLKIHFRALVDYTIVEGPILHYHGLKALVMTTTAIARPRLTIVGIVDCERVRDMLAAIDAARENPRPSLGGTRSRKV